MKYSGRIGYANDEELAVDTWNQTPVERSYVGDVIRNYQRWQMSEQLNDNMNVSNQLSIVADPFMFENFGHIRYAEWNGVLWKVTGVELRYPRVLLTLGGVWNGDSDRTP